MGPAVFFSRTATVTLCSGGLAARKLNVADVSWCSLADSVSAKVAIQEYTPSSPGATRFTTVSYSALVPRAGVSPSLPLPMSIPAASRTTISCPVNWHPTEHFTPTLTVNGRFTTTGAGTLHTAMLVGCGALLVTDSCTRC